MYGTMRALRTACFAKIPGIPDCTSREFTQVAGSWPCELDATTVLSVCWNGPIQWFGSGSARTTNMNGSWRIADAMKPPAAQDELVKTP